MKPHPLSTLFAGIIMISLSGCGSLPNGSSVASGYLNGEVNHYQDVPSNLERAASDGETAIVENPANVNGYVALANTFVHLRQPEVAVHELTEAVSLRPHDSTLWNDLGLLAWSIHQPGLASQAWQKAVRQNPGNWMAWDGLGAIALNQSQWSLATSDLQQSLVVGGTQGPTLDFMGEEAMALGNWQSAAIYFRDTIQATPQWWQGYYDLAKVDLHWGELSAAESNLHAALGLYPGSGKAWLLLQSLPQPVANNS